MESTMSTAWPTEAPALGPFSGRPLSEGVRVLVSTLGWLACVSGVFGNVLIISTLLSQPALRSLHNLYIGNLALADLVVVGYCVPFWLLDLALGRAPILNQQHCSANSFLLFLCVNASIYTLVLIGFNRYLCVCHPGLYAKLFTKTNTIAACVGVWVFSACVAVLPLFRVHHTAFVYSIKVRMCSYNGTETGNLFSILSVINIVLPTILVGFFSLSIFRCWKQSRSRIGQWTRNRSQSQLQVQVQVPKRRPGLSSANIALVRSLVLVFLLLVLLYIPLSVVVALTGSVPVSSDVYSILVLVFFLNNSINWIVYGVMNKSFKDGYRRLLLARCMGPSPSVEVEGTLRTLATIQ